MLKTRNRRYRGALVPGRALQGPAGFNWRPSGELILQLLEEAGGDLIPQRGREMGSNSELRLLSPPPPSMRLDKAGEARRLSTSGPHTPQGLEGGPRGELSLKPTGTTGGQEGMRWSGAGLVDTLLSPSHLPVCYVASWEAELAPHSEALSWC